MSESIEISSSCICYDDEGNPIDDCWGCYEDAKENLHHFLIQWLGENNAPSGTMVYIQGKDMTWQRLDGHAAVSANLILSTLELDRADYRIEFTLNGKELTAKRWSHDEPMGASFTFSIQKEQDNG